MRPHTFKLYLVVLIFSFVSACATQTKTLPTSNLESSLRVATFNIAYLSLNEKGIKNWNDRKESVALMIEDIAPDIMGFQEMESFGGAHSRNENFQLDYVLKEHPSYAAAAYAKDASQYPITQPIIYKKDKFDVLDQGFFFFSDTPDTIYSSTFNGSYPAFCSWATFKNIKTDESFTVFNMHTDYASKSNRLKSAELMTARISPRVTSGDTVILLGDLNASYKSKPAKLLKTIPLEFVPPAGSTFHFNKGLNITSAIDHILHTADVEPVGELIVSRKKYAKQWPSDHYPIAADLKFTNNRN